MEARAGGVKLVGPTDSDEVFLGSIGVRFLIDGAEAGERFNGASIADRAERAQRGHPDVRQLAAPFI